MITGSLGKPSLSNPQQIRLPADRVATDEVARCARRWHFFKLTPSTTVSLISQSCHVALPSGAGGSVWRQITFLYSLVRWMFECFSLAFVRVFLPFLSWPHLPPSPSFIDVWHACTSSWKQFVALWLCPSKQLYACLISDVVSASLVLFLFSFWGF